MPNSAGMVLQPF